MEAAPHAVEDLGLRGDAPADDRGRGRAPLRALRAALSGTVLARKRAAPRRARRVVGPRATTAGPGSSTPRRGTASRSSAVKSRGRSRICVRCPASASTRRARSPRSASACREPAVDGNVARVWSRFEAEAADPASASDRRRLAALLRPSIPEDRAGAFNEALIELGATVCRPVEPRCEDCPIRRGCLAFQREEVARYPGPSRRRASVPITSARGILRDGGGRVLVVRRPASASLLAGFDELPGRWLAPGEEPEAALADVFSELGFRDVRIGARRLERAARDHAPQDPFRRVRGGRSQARGRSRARASSRSRTSPACPSRPKPASSPPRRRSRR